MGREPSGRGVLVCVPAGCRLQLLAKQSRDSRLHSVPLVLKTRASELLVERRRSRQEFRRSFQRIVRSLAAHAVAIRVAGGGCLYKEGRERVAMGEAGGTLHSANLPVRPAWSNKSGSSVVVRSELKKATAIDATRHGRGHGGRAPCVDGRRRAQVAGERRRHGGGRPGPGLQRAAALRRARVPRRARPRALLAPRAAPPHRRGGELAHGRHRGGGGRRMRRGHHVRRGHHQGLRPLRHLLLHTGQAPCLSQKFGLYICGLHYPYYIVQFGGSGDGRAGGGAERADDGGDGGDPEEGVRRAGGHREAVDDGLQAQRLSEQDLKLPLN